jgi:nanoRNase/pAp phosphatase (c-di-AMP/oligoRNAs hydrolase)
VTVEPLSLLLDALRGAQAVLILPHNDPDPDAIAGAVALRHLIQLCLGVQSEIAYKGIIGRAENKALVRELGDPLHPLWPSDLEREVAIVLIDTRPGAGNNALPPGRKATVVIDHHSAPPADVVSSPDSDTRANEAYTERGASDVEACAEFADLRPEIGAISTILTEYIQSAGIELPSALATALFYGIKTDTRGLSRGASQADVDAYFYLQKRADLDVLASIERAQVPREYFQSLVATLRAARRYDHLLVSYLGKLSYPDLVAEMADLLLRLEGIRWVLCMGAHEGVLLLSVRTRLAYGADRLIHHIVGPQGTAGGHGSMSGGQIPLEGLEPDQADELHQADGLRQLIRTVKQRALYHLGIEPEGDGEPLIACPSRSADKKRLLE